MLNSFALASSHHGVAAAHKVVLVYQIHQVPEFDFDAREGKVLGQALAAQRQLLSGISRWLRDKGSFNLELRFKNDPQTASVKAYFMVNVAFAAEIAKRYPREKLNENIVLHLPDGFELSLLDEAAHLQVLGQEEIQVMYQIGRVPMVIPVGNFMVQYRTQPILSPLINPVAAAQKEASQANGFAYAVPAVPLLVANNENWRVFFRQLANACSQVDVRIAINCQQVTADEKMRATHYYQQLMQTPLRSVVRTPLEQRQLDGLGKYLDQHWLYAANIQVASTDGLAGDNLAHALLSQLEGTDNSGLFSVTQVPLPISALKAMWQNGHLYAAPFPTAVCQRRELDEIFLRECLHVYTEAELTNLFRWPFADTDGLSGFEARPLAAFHPPTTPKKSGRLVTIGTVEPSGAKLRNVDKALPYHVRLDSLAKHALLVGMPGSGKTNSTLFITSELLKNDVPFLLIEPCKSEYFDALKSLRSASGQEIKRFQARHPFKEDGSLEPTFLRFNPLVPVPGTTISEHISFIKGALMAAAPLEGIMPAIFEDFLHEFYRSKLPSKQSLYDSKLDIVALLQPELLSVTQFRSFATSYFSDTKRFNPASKTTQEIVSILQRRILRLTEGLLGEIFSPELCQVDGRNLMQENLQTMLHAPCIVDLESVGDDDDKSLLMAFVLTFLYEDRMQRKSHDPNNQLHIAIVEEAHRLLHAGTSSVKSGSETLNATAKAAALFNNFFAEGRAKAQGFIIVEQSPGKLPADVLKNTGTKIMHRLNYQEDREYLGQAMGMSEEQIARACVLKTGEAIWFDDSLNKPILIKIKEFKTT